MDDEEGKDNRKFDGRGVSELLETTDPKQKPIHTWGNLSGRHQILAPRDDVTLEAIEGVPSRPFKMHYTKKELIDLFNNFAECMKTNEEGIYQYKFATEEGIRKFLKLKLGARIQIPKSVYATSLHESLMHFANSDLVQPEPITHLQIQRANQARLQAHFLPESARIQENRLNDRVRVNLEDPPVESATEPSFVQSTVAGTSDVS